MPERSPFDVPLAAYRLQFHGAFTFDHASAIVPSRMGIGKADNPGWLDVLEWRIGTERVSFWPNVDFLRGSVVHGTVNRHFVDVLSGAPANAGGAGFALDQVLHALPVAVLRSA